MGNAVTPPFSRGKAAVIIDSRDVPGRDDDQVFTPLWWKGISHAVGAGDFRQDQRRKGLQKTAGICFAKQIGSQALVQSIDGIPIQQFTAQPGRQALVNDAIAYLRVGILEAVQQGHGQRVAFRRRKLKARLPDIEETPLAETVWWAVRRHRRCQDNEEKECWNDTVSCHVRALSHR